MKDLSLKRKKIVFEMFDRDVCITLCFTFHNALVVICEANSYSGSISCSSSAINKGFK